MGCVVDANSGQVPVSAKLWGYKNPNTRQLWNVTQLRDEGLVDGLRFRPLRSEEDMFLVTWNRLLKRRGPGAKAINEDEDRKGNWDMEPAYNYFGVDWRRKKSKG
jgi:hypothetical protein